MLCPAMYVGKRNSCQRKHRISDIFIFLIFSVSSFLAFTKIIGRTKSSASRSYSLFTCHSLFTILLFDGIGTFVVPYDHYE